MIWVVIFFPVCWQTSLNKNIPREYSGNADFVYPIKSQTIFILDDGWFFFFFIKQLLDAMETAQKW